MILEITPHELAARLADPTPFVLLDVREALELRLARLDDPRVEWSPLSRLAYSGFEALPAPVRADKQAEIVVFCHHGMRSADVTAWLQSQGWMQVRNLEGGIDAYARLIDPKVGIYE
ncbi:MAG: hypothetical protein EHM70_22720 [Chloroflexota bacterium]|nr:MAG: hypothetical protein EHM70_22720 [Chloroflexota bacterium]